ncbi:MAG: tRNA uridine-5-carboxymethylaminomethyl(34) synthesis GTPase MnmE [Thalassobaculales bacterium]
MAVLRLSGPASGAALAALAGDLPAPRRAVVRRLRREGEILDRALVLWLPGPASYTGEDMAELQVHGGRAVVAAVAAALAGLGLRPAQPGEFTRRAFDNGRMDLAEAESVGDLVDARTEAQRRQAVAQLEGGLSGRIEGWRAALLRALALLEAAIDFAEEDVPDDLPAEVAGRVEALRREMAGELALAQRAAAVRDGLRIAILGAPNVGKSSLLNALAGRPAAIVSDRPGTTRDVVEVALDLGGVMVVLADTAGMRDTEDVVEAEGVRRARAWAAGADLTILVTSPDIPVPPAGVSPDIVVWNKSDLKPRGPAGSISVSARDGAGLALLLDRLAALARERVGDGTGVLARLRHRQAVEAALAALDRYGTAPDLAAAGEELRLALREIGRVTGAVDVEDLLDVIFSSFCIGK